MTQSLLRTLDWIRHKLRCRAVPPAQALGERGEDLAHRFLRAHGMFVVARKYRPPNAPGEIDLVCWDRDTLVFVEVKSRSTDEFGAPGRAVDAAKRNALIDAAGHYVRRAGASWDSVRFDVVEVLLGRSVQIEHHRNAFSPSRQTHTRAL
ncbi:MAG: YraN family protein [Bryobacteraceae bacterium]|nr:YraN family protein [Bryobacteraceae bacterium]